MKPLSKHQTDILLAMADGAEIQYTGGCDGRYILVGDSPISSSVVRWTTVNALEKVDLILMIPTGSSWKCVIAKKGMDVVMSMRK